MRLPVQAFFIQSSQLTEIIIIDIKNTQLFSYVS